MILWMTWPADMGSLPETNAPPLPRAAAANLAHLVATLDTTQIETYQRSTIRLKCNNPNIATSMLAKLPDVPFPTACTRLTTGASLYCRHRAMKFYSAGAVSAYVDIAQWACHKVKNRLPIRH